MSNIETIVVAESVELLTPTQPAQARALRTKPAHAGQPRPSIVWRSPSRPVRYGPRQAAGLYLVTEASQPRADRRRSGYRMTAVVRTHIAESAYLAATLGTALAIWWSVR